MISFRIFIVLYKRFIIFTTKEIDYETRLEQSFN
jgi:hypothetical protein